MEYDFRPTQEEEVKEEEAPPPSRAGWRLPEPSAAPRPTRQSDGGAPLVALPTPLPRADANAVAAAARATRKSSDGPLAALPTLPPLADAVAASRKRSDGAAEPPPPKKPRAEAPAAAAAAKPAAVKSIPGRERPALRNEIAGKARFAADVQLCGTPGCKRPAHHDGLCSTEQPSARRR